MKLFDAYHKIVEGDGGERARYEHGTTLSVRLTQSVADTPEAAGPCDQLTAMSATSDARALGNKEEGYGLRPRCLLRPTEKARMAYIR